MLRYLILSAAIVFAVAIAATAWMDRDLIRIKIASVNLRVPPKPSATSAPGGAEAPLRGDAPWALSALPECLIQTSQSIGPEAYVRAHLPSGLVPVVPPATLSYGDCTIFVTGDEAYVRRGADKMRIPPRARFYRGRGVLAMIRRSAERTELRVYQTALPIR